MSLSIDTFTNLDLPDAGDLIKDGAKLVGCDEKTANLVATGGCFMMGDVWGTAEHGMDVVEDQGLLDGEVRVSHGFRGGAYPAPDDVEGWKEWIQVNGYEAFIEAYKAGVVDDEVLADEGFNLIFQDEQGRYEAAITFRSNLLASENRLRELIANNMRG
jgi:hypothetical protein